MSVFKDNQKYSKLPYPIAVSVQELLYEREHSGIHTTPDESADVIESIFTFLGRLWICEYIHVATHSKSTSGEINRWLFDLIVETKKGLTVGRWVGICRHLHEYFFSHKLTPITKGLLDQDYGKMGDKTHPVAQMIDFRNRFAHGNFNSIVKEIEHIFELMDKFLTKITGLYCQPIIGHVDQVWVAANLSFSTPQKTISDAMSGELFLLGDESNLSLSHFFCLQYSDTWQLTSNTLEGLTVDEIFYHQILHVWVQQYQHERAGNISFDAAIQAEESQTLTEEVQQEIINGLQRYGSLILAESYPGCSKIAIIKMLLSHEAIISSHDAVKVIDVKTGHLGQSGYTVAQIVLRTIEKTCSLPTGSLGQSLNTIKDDLENAFKILAQSGKKILLGIENLHLGEKPYRQEPITVLDVYRILADAPISVVATTHCGAIRSPLFYDLRVVIEPPEKIHMEQLKAEVKSLCQLSTLHQKVLRVLGRNNHPLHLFEICDLLEKEEQQTMIFEPKVERSLWDLRPVLKMYREKRTIEGKQENARIWQVFSSKVAEVLTGVV